MERIWEGAWLSHFIFPKNVFSKFLYVKKNIPHQKGANKIIKTPAAPDMDKIGFEKE